jgi:hypothetical protein
LVYQKSFGGSKMNGLSGTLPPPENKDLTVDHGRKSYVEVLVGKGQS